MDARTISGDEEARLTFLGATAGRNDDRETVVIDIGGGSTEYVVGRPGEDAELPYLHADGLRAAHGAVPEDRSAGSRRARRSCAEAVRETVPDVTAEHAIAVAGTATSLAAIDGAEEVHGYRLNLGACERITAMLAGMPLEERRDVKGLHPDRAPTIVAGAVILTESVRTLGLGEVEIIRPRHPARRGRCGLEKRIARIMRAILLNGPIRTGRGTCHERALRFGRREAPIRCGFARTYVPDGNLRVRRRPTPPSGPTITQPGE